jgi:hypothetical protein
MAGGLRRGWVLTSPPDSFNLILRPKNLFRFGFVALADDLGSVPYMLRTCSKWKKRRAICYPFSYRTKIRIISSRRPSNFVLDY